MKKLFYCDSSAVETCTYSMPEGDILFVQHVEDVLSMLPEKRVNIGEYYAVLTTIELAKRLKVDDLEIKSDSQLVVNQVSGRWKCRFSHLQSLRDKIRARSKEFRSFSLTWVHREENPAGKVLEGRKLR